MKKDLLIFLLVFSFSLKLIAQNDTTNDSWLSNNNSLSTAEPVKIEGSYNNYLASVINNSGGSGAGGLLIETTDGNGIANALKIVIYRNNSPKIPLRIPNHSAAGNRVFLVEEGGKVGIGTTTPENALDVCGFIRSEEVIVEDGWCDFVFDKEYQLPTLLAQKIFIEKNGHLKNFQSEKEMNGQIHVGDVNKRQQQTLEEVMLYLIDMQEQLTTLKKQNQLLQKEMEMLKSKN